MKTIDKTGGSQKPADMQKSTSLGETKKPATTLMRMGTMSKVLDISLLT